MRELLLEGSDWPNYLRMNQTTYFELLALVTRLIQRSDTVMRKAITPHEILTATLRYIATGCTYEDLKFPTAVFPQSLGKIIPETCKALYKALAD